MLRTHSAPAQLVHLLPDDGRAIVAAIRHMVVGWPRSPIAHALLIDRYGDAGVGIEHLLRCLLVGIGRLSQRKLTVGAPCSAFLLPDETALLDAIGGDGAQPDPSALVRLTGTAKGAQLAPIARLVGETLGREARADACSSGAPFEEF